jgi:hypothetical protein
MEHTVRNMRHAARTPHSMRRRISRGPGPPSSATRGTFLRRRCGCLRARPLSPAYSRQSPCRWRADWVAHFIVPVVVARRACSVLRSSRWSWS